MARRAREKRRGPAPVVRLADLPDVLTPEEAAAVLRIRSARPDQAVARLLAPVRINRRVRFRKADLAEYLGRATKGDDR